MAFSFYERLEHFAILGTPVNLVVGTGSHSRLIEGRQIVDLFTRDGGEFLRLTDGQCIRLDHIVEIVGQA